MVFCFCCYGHCHACRLVVVVVNDVGVVVVNVVGVAVVIVVVMVITIDNIVVLAKSGRGKVRFLVIIIEFMNEAAMF